MFVLSGIPANVMFGRHADSAISIQRRITLNLKTLKLGR